jgi:hypothetical protein
MNIEINPPMEGPMAVSNGLQGSIRNMLTLVGLKPVTRYEIKISTVFDSTKQTDPAIIVQETAPSSSGLKISEILSTSFVLSWDAIDNVENYNVLIRPSVDGFNGERSADDRSVTVENLIPGTPYTVFVSGTLFNGVQTDPTASKATTPELLANPVFSTIRSTSAAIELEQLDHDNDWLIQVTDTENNHVGHIESDSDNSFSITHLEPSHEYILVVQANYRSAKSDPITTSFTTAPLPPLLELRNVQTTAFNVLWFKSYHAVNYRIVIEPPVLDFENGVLDFEEDDAADHLSVYEAEGNTEYTVTISAILGDNIETDSVTGSLITAFEMEIPIASEITENSARLSWADHFHGEDHDENGVEDHDDNLEDEHEDDNDHDDEASGDDFGGIEVDLISHRRHLKVIGYRVNINPPIPGQDYRNGVTETELVLTGLEPATEYRVELFAVLTTGAETDLVEAVFVTEGEKSVVDKSQCALSYQSLLQSDHIATECDFEDGTMCGWNQNRGGGKRYMWRIDTERSVSKSDKSKVLVAPFMKQSKNNEAQLYSPMLSGPKCIEMEVLMFRRNVNALTISIVHEHNHSKVAELKGPQGHRWVPLKHSIFLPDSLSYKIVITATKGGDWRSTIALDNIKISDGPCWSNL